MFSAALNYISRGNAKMKGKKPMLYIVLVIAYIISIVPNLVLLCIPSFRDYYGDGFELIGAYIQNDQDTIDRLNGKTNEDENVYKSQGQLMAEEYEAKNQKNAIQRITGSMNTVNFIYDAVVTNVVQIGIAAIFIGVGKKTVGVRDMFSGFTEGNYFSKMISVALKKLAVKVAYAFCIIPGIFLNYALFMVEYLMADDPKLTFTRSWEISWQATKGYKLKLFIIDLIFGAPIYIGFIVIVAYLKILPPTDDPAKIILPMLYTLAAVVIAGIILLPYRKAAESEVYADAKADAKSYGIIRRGFELFDETDIEDTDGPRMTYFVG